MARSNSESFSERSLATASFASNSARSSSAEDPSLLAKFPEAEVERKRELLSVRSSAKPASFVLSSSICWEP